MPSLSQGGSRWRIFVPLLVLGLAVGGYFGVQWWLYTLSHVSTDDARVKGTLITVSAEVPGRLLSVPIEAGQPINQGDLLARIDPEFYELEVAQRQAALEAVQSQLARAEIEHELAQAQTEGNIEVSEAVLNASQSQLSEVQGAAQLENKRVQAELRGQEAAVEEARAQLAGTKAQLDVAAAESERAERLFQDGIIAAEQRDQVTAAYNFALAQHQSVQERLNKDLVLLQRARDESQRVQLRLESVRTQEQKVEESQALKTQAVDVGRLGNMAQAEGLKDLRAKVKEAETELALARLRLEKTVIHSPVTGSVSQAIADSGEHVRAGQPIAIVNDPQDVWVSANIEETRIRQVQLGQPVDIAVDAYPDQSFQGQVHQIGAATRSEFAIIPAGSASAHFIKVTQRIPVRIVVENPDNLLKPGMMVEVGIQVR
jgi:membrane fusion protein (multidrug efflux system)